MVILIDTVERDKQCDFERPEYKTSGQYGRLKSFKKLVGDKFKKTYYCY